MSRSIFHTDRKWVAGICYVGFLLLTLMLASLMNLWVDKDARFIRIYGGVVWIYGWSYLYHRWVRRCTTWLA